MRNHATGPGPRTEDGCSVELYRRLRPGDEPAIVQSVLAVGSTILELGSGVGRITRPLSEAGFRVTAVDSSAEMLAHVTNAETVLGQIETLDLNRTFDGVLLGSHLINVADDGERAAMLRTCRRHVASAGVVLIETFVPSRIAALEEGLLDESHGIRCSITNMTRSASAFSATLVYEASDATWTQSFTAALFDEDELRQLLLQAGLVFREWLNDRRSWFSATIPSS